MSEKYEQMELDTRPLLQAAIEDLTQSAITNTGQLIKEHHRQVAQETMTATRLTGSQPSSWRRSPARSSPSRTTPAPCWAPWPIPTSTPSMPPAPS